MDMLSLSCPRKEEEDSKVYDNSKHGDGGRDFDKVSVSKEANL